MQPTWVLERFMTKDELDDILISLKEWVVNAEYRLNRLEQAQPAQEPVAIVYSMQDGYVGQMIVKDIPHKTPLYTKEKNT